MKHFSDRAVMKIRRNSTKKGDTMSESDGDCDSGSCEECAAGLWVTAVNDVSKST